MMQRKESSNIREEADQTELIMMLHNGGPNDEEQSDAGSVASSMLSLTASAMDRNRCRSKVLISMSAFLLLWLVAVMAAHQIRFASEVPDGAAPGSGGGDLNLNNKNMHLFPTEGKGTTSATTTAGGTTAGNDDKKKNLDTKRYVMELATLKPVYSNATTRTNGTVIIETNSSWAPIGAQHFHELVTQNQFYDGCKFFRVAPNHMAEFGLNGDPALQSHIEKTVLRDDPVVVSNKRGRITFVSSGPNTRTTQIFINYEDNSKYLDKKGLAPFGTVDTNGMNYIDKINDRYGEKPDEKQIHERGNEYLDKEFPHLSYIVSIREE